jgi:hypothetical protein
MRRHATYRRKKYATLFRKLHTATAERFTITTLTDVTDAGGTLTTYGFVSAGSALYDTHDHGAAALSDGRVLIVGGKRVTDGSTATYPKRAELYTP